MVATLSFATPWTSVLKASVRDTAYLPTKGQIKVYPGLGLPPRSQQSNDWMKSRNNFPVLSLKALARDSNVLSDRMGIRHPPGAQARDRPFRGIGRIVADQRGPKWRITLCSTRTISNPVFS